MKKSIVLALAAGMIMTAGTALANPVELDGSVSYQYRANTYDNYKDADGNLVKDTNGNKFTFILNAKTALDKNVDLYARMGAQGLSQAGFGADFNTKVGNDTFRADLDQFGIIVKDTNFTYKIGRQDATIGGTALLYSTGGYLGKNMFADGISIDGKTGVTNLKVYALQEDNIGKDDNKLYAVQASYNPTKEWTLGATVAKYDYAAAGSKDTNHWAVNAAYNVGDTTIFGEYTKSNANASNKAYDLGVSYNMDTNNSVYVIAHKVEANADMGGWTDFDNNEKGIYYGFNHKINDASKLTVFYKDNKKVSDSNQKATSLRATVTYNF